MNSEMLLYLLQKFNDYEVPLLMSPDDVRNYLQTFFDEFEQPKKRKMNSWRETVLD